MISIIASLAKVGAPNVKATSEQMSKKAWTFDLATREFTEHKDETFCLPNQRSRGSGAKNIPNYLYDTARYVLDLQSTFWKQTQEILKECGEKKLLTVVQGSLECSFEPPKGIKPENWVILTYQGKILAQRPKVQAWVQGVFQQVEGIDGICIATGKPGKLARLHDDIVGLGGKKCKLCSANLGAFKYNHRKQGANFPVTVETSRAYAQGLNDALAHTSAFLDDTTALVFWCETDLPPIIPLACQVFNRYTKTETAGKLWEDIEALTPGKAEIHMLLLQANDSRLRILQYQVIPAADLHANLLRFKQDFSEWKAPTFGAVTYIGDKQTIYPRLRCNLTWAIATGSPYPYEVIQHFWTTIKRGVWSEAVHNREMGRTPMNPVKPEELLKLSTEHTIDQGCYDSDRFRPEQRIEREAYMFGRLVAAYAHMKATSKNMKRKDRDKLFGRELDRAMEYPSQFFGSTSTHPQLYQQCIRRDLGYIEQAYDNLFDRTAFPDLDLIRTPRLKSYIIVGFRHQSRALGAYLDAYWMEWRKVNPKKTSELVEDSPASV